jgi:DNA adenine methylase
MAKEPATPNPCPAAPQRPVLAYLGSKWSIAPWVIDHMPPHSVYVEPFGGGASVLLRKDPSPLEIYNDLDSAVVNFWRVLREQPDELVALLRATPWSREEYVAAWGDETGMPALERARRLYVRTWMCFNASTDAPKGWRAAKRPKSGSVVAWGDEPRLLAVAVRWRMVQIEHDDAIKVIRRFDTPEALFYCDPPYVHSTRSSKTGYRHEMTDGDHLELLDTLNSIKGGAMLSSYPSELYKKQLPARRWKCVTRMARTRNPTANRLEVLWIKKS